jgi:tetratricopeptide (TPR) repeat protein
VLLEALRQNPTNSDAQKDARAFGVQLLRDRNYQKAAELFIALREAVPEDPATLYGGALAFFNLQRNAEAESWVRAAIDKSAVKKTTSTPATFASLADSLVLLGVILAVKGDNAGSLEVISRAVKIAPENFDAQFALGRARYGAGDPAGAARAFRAALVLRPKDRQAHFFLCTALEQAGDDSAALEAYRAFIRIAPDAAEAHLGLGVLLAKKEKADLNEAILELKKALVLDEKLYEGQVTLGKALIRSGRDAEALSHLKRAVELAPENPEPHYQLSIALRRLGKKEEADKETDRVKQIHESRRGTKVSKGEKSPNQR